MLPSLTPSARIIWLLSPVARMAVPRSVRKNKYMSTPTRAIAIPVSASMEASRAATSQPNTLMLSPRDTLAELLRPG